MLEVVTGAEGSTLAREHDDVDLGIVVRSLDGSPDLAIATDASTRFVGATGFADLKVGDRVLVQGTLQTDGSVKAALVVKRPVAPPIRDEVELEGAITSITAPDRFEVAGKTAVIDSATHFDGEHERGLTFADLKVGDRVEVEGMAQADGTILARKVERQDAEEDHH